MNLKPSSHILGKEEVRKRANTENRSARHVFEREKEEQKKEDTYFICAEKEKRRQKEMEHVRKTGSPKL